ncbi:MAG TPA: hypothetical protein VF553_07235 [Pyrinomonadaceae bacterium]|jgi:hypothetical protein
MMRNLPPRTQRRRLDRTPKTASMDFGQRARKGGSFNHVAEHGFKSVCLGWLSAARDH